MLSPYFFYFLPLFQLQIQNNRKKLKYFNFYSSEPHFPSFIFSVASTRSHYNTEVTFYSAFCRPSQPSKPICSFLIIQLYSQMGNECNICDNTENRPIRETQVDEKPQEVAKAPEPYRPSVSKNDQPYFEQTHEQKTSTPQSVGLQKRAPIRFNKGIVYEGTWRGQIREGQGIQVWPDGARYEGQWANDKANGKGKFIHVDGDIYEGQWKNDKASGFGTYHHNNGAKYIGEWLDDLQHGKGVETWVDGSRYEGYYNLGKKNGRGKYIWKDGSFYDGDWVDNKITGSGKYIWSDGRRYEGEWLNNQMHGKGRYQWKDGRLYEGEYVYDKKHGIGSYRWADGRRYIGEWVNSKRSGKGKIIGVDGTEREGVWQNDKRVRWLNEPEETSQIKSTYSKLV